jgi:hypothetical protein
MVQTSDYEEKKERDGEHAGVNKKGAKAQVIIRFVAWGCSPAHVYDVAADQFGCVRRDNNKKRKVG